jgi:hypothetical protein
MKRLYNEEENSMSHHLDQAKIAQDPEFRDLVRMSLATKITSVLEDAQSTDINKKIATLTSTQILRVLPDVSDWIAGADLSTSSTDAQIDAQINTIWGTSLAYRIGAITP